MGALGGGIAGAVGSSKAAGAQSKAALSTAQLQSQDAQAALAEQKRQFDITQGNIAPWLTAGKGGLAELSRLLGIGGGSGFADFGSLLKGFSEKFQAPTDVTEQNDPGYKFRLDQGMQALQNSAAARGSLLSGGTLRALNDYAQNYASNEYGNVYGRALGEYQQRYNIFQNQQANEYNRLAGISGTGQTAAGQLGQLGQASSSNIANILLGSGAQIGRSLENAGAARASGYAGVANSVTGATGGLTNLALLASLLAKTGAPPIYGLNDPTATGG